MISVGNFDHYINHNAIYQDPRASDLIENPFISVVNEMIRKGQVPLWDSYNSLGMPLVHNTNNSMLAPLQQLVNFNNTETMWEVMYLVRLWIIMYGTFLLCRKLGLILQASAAAGIFIGFSGYVTVFFNIFFLHVDAFLPLLLFFSISYFQKPSAGNWAGNVLCIMAMVLGGNPQNLILNCVFAVWLVTAWTISHRRNAACRLVLGYIGAYASSVIFTLAYWLAFLRSYSRGNIARDPSGDSAVGMYVKSLAELFGFLFPMSSFSSKHCYVMPAFGLSVLCICIFQLRFGKNKVLKTALLAFVCLFILKIAGCPLVHWIGKLPVLDQMMFTKYNFSIYLAVSILAAYAIQDYYEEETSKVRDIGMYLSLFGIWILYLTVFIWYKNVTNAVYIVCAIAFCLLCYRFFVKDKKRGLYVLVFLSSLEPVCITIHNCHFMIEKNYAFQEPECVKALKRADREIFAQRTGVKSRVFCINRVFLGNVLSYWGLENISGISATPDQRYFDFMKELVLGQKVDMQWAATSSSEYDPKSKRILDLLGVNYIISDDYGVVEDSSLITIYDSVRCKVYYNPMALQRCFTVHDIKYLEKKEDIFAFLKDETQDLSKVAVVSGAKQKFDVGSEVSEEDMIEIQKDYGNSAKIKCTMANNGLLVLSDLQYPGWRVYVNGKREDIVTVDYILRGVFLEKGEYEVEFKYVPMEIYAGLMVSCLYLFLLLCCYKKTVSASKSILPDNKRKKGRYI